jgi:transcriptional regulator with XRE-family HTH domain
MQTGIGHRIAQAREAAGMTRVELAWRLRCSVPLVEAWERGTRNPAASLDRLSRLAETLGRPVSWFFESGEREAA